jgi:hypothetical protein
MKAKNWIRVVVVAGLLSWPGVELYRNYVAHQQLAASREVGRAVNAKLAALKSAQQVATARAATTVE